MGFRVFRASGFLGLEGLRGPFWSHLMVEVLVLGDLAVEVHVGEHAECVQVHEQGLAVHGRGELGPVVEQVDYRLKVLPQ
eukprot:6370052-Pyramimonas_sp.AAC.1